jgi:bifunctional ADP-heptose synthase (sugar kinase/adenylyltransferase)
MNAFLIGDFMLDRYELGKVERISPEAPVPVVKLIKRRSSPGGAGHVGASLAGLGLAVTAAGILGDDPAGRDLISGLESRSIDTRGLSLVSGLPTIVKTRIIAERYFQVARIDVELHQLES